MTLAHFIALTRDVIAEDGIDDYLPTLMFPKSRRICVIESVPESVDVEAFAKDWAANTLTAPSDDYYLAFKADHEHFKVITQKDGITTEELFSIK